MAKSKNPNPIFQTLVFLITFSVATAILAKLSVFVGFAVACKVVGWL